MWIKPHFSMAVATEITIGGSCPRGGLDASGVNILTIYPNLIESTTLDPSERTKLNIEHSDGTLITVPDSPLPVSITDGT